MPNPHDISYLDCFCADDDDIFLLAKSAFDLRTKDTSVMPTRNVGSTLFYYQGQRFPPLPAASLHSIGHGERLSFVELVRRAIRKRWGPFAQFPGNGSTIQDNLSLSNIQTIPGLLSCLQYLDSFKVFSERAFCDYIDQDIGCLSFFNQLDALLGKNKAQLFQAIPKFLSESTNQERICEAMLTLQKNQALIEERYLIIQEKKKLKESLESEWKLVREQIEATISELEMQYGETQNSQDKERISQQIIDAKQILEIEREKSSDTYYHELAILEAQEYEIISQLKIALKGEVEQSSRIESSRPNTPANKKGLVGVQMSQFISNSDQFLLGTAINDGGCFFDAIAQTLNTHFKTTLYSQKSLRMKCYEYYMEHKEEVDAWNQQDYGGIDQGEQYKMVQYTTPEMDQNFHEQPPIWGRPNIEGKILCRALNLEAILVLEILEDPATKAKVPGFRRVTSNDDKTIDNDEADRLIQEQKYPVLVCDQKALHFVPLLSKASLEDSSRLGPTREIQSTQLLDLQGMLEQGRNTGQGLATGTVSHTTILPGFGTTTHTASSPAHSAENNSSKDKLPPAKRQRRKDDEGRESPKPL